MRLYCTGSYPSHSWEAPGIGVVLTADSARIEYRWIPFARAIVKSTIDGNLDDNATTKFKSIRFVANWLIEMSEASF